MSFIIQPGVARPRAVIFDWDNTLVDSWATIHAALFETFQAMGHEPWTLEQTRERVRYSLRESFPKLFGDRWEDAMRLFYAAFERAHIEHLTPLPGAGEMLQAMHGAGFCLAVVSNKTGRYLRAEAEHLEWARFFHRVVGAGDAARDKPAEDPVHLALEGSGIPAGGDVWFVGDAGIDMEIAHITGCTPVLVGIADLEGEEFRLFQPKVRFGSCIELAGCVAAL
ncbi:MAG: HAD family hydrolase [Alphaproteobacteria bacterium]